MRNFLFLCAIIIASTNLFYAAQFKAHNLFSDNMVLQQDSEIRIATIPLTLAESPCANVDVA